MVNELFINNEENGGNVAVKTNRTDNNGAVQKDIIFEIIEENQKNTASKLLLNWYMEKVRNVGKFKV
jgi:hypothetical protein